MRQIFTSQRLETVEGVAQLLEEHGIETYTSHSRSYRGQRRGEFSYSATAGHDPQPGVWIVRADQLLPAREILREARLLESTQTGSFLPSGTSTAADERTPRARLVSHIRLALLATVSVMAVFTSVKMFVAG